MSGLSTPVIFTDRSKAVLLLRFIFICYHIYNVCLLHDFVATLGLSTLPSALYFILSKLALWPSIAAHPAFRKTKCLFYVSHFRSYYSLFLSYNKLRARLGSRKTGLSSPPPSILILTVPRHYFCCGSLLLLVLAVSIYTLVQLHVLR